METLVDRAFARFDAENAEDPHELEVDGALRPKELVFAERLTVWVRRVKPAASEALLLASRCQHLRRWEIPRSRFPEGRQGYLAWRRELATFHAERAARILGELGASAALVDAVRAINLKRDLGADTDTQAMEDALCLSFLEHELADFASKHEPEKIVSILKKSWRKMSPRGRELAQQLPLAPELRALVARALVERQSKKP